MQRTSSVHKAVLSGRKGSSAWMCAFCLLHIMQWTQHKQRGSMWIDLEQIIYFEAAEVR